MGDADAADGEVLARYASLDWVVLPSGGRLHAPAEFTTDPLEWCLTDVVTACGLRRDRAFIPGVFTRMGATRCARCCDRSGLPRGTGSPKNDETCRQILGLPPASSTGGGEE